MSRPPAWGQVLFVLDSRRREANNLPFTAICGECWRVQGVETEGAGDAWLTAHHREAHASEEKVRS